MLSKRLPRYMVPQQHRRSSTQMPLTIARQDRRNRACRRYSVDDGPSAAPETETEIALAAVLAELLDGAESRRHRGIPVDSASTASSRCRSCRRARRRGIPLRARLMLECATVRELAAAIDSESVTVECGGARRAAGPSRYCRTCTGSTSTAIRGGWRRPRRSGCRTGSPGRTWTACCGRRRRSRGAAQPTRPRHHDARRARSEGHPDRGVGRGRPHRRGCRAGPQLGGTP